MGRDTERYRIEGHARDESSVLHTTLSRSKFLCLVGKQ